MVADRVDRLRHRGRPRWHEALGRRGRPGPQRPPSGDALLAWNRPGGRARHGRRRDRRGARRDRGIVGHRARGGHRDPVPHRPGARHGGQLGQPAARRRPVSRDHGRAARAAGLRRQRRQRRDARRVALRRGGRRARRGAAHARDRHRRRPGCRQRAAARQPGRGGRARAHGRAGGRPALPAQLPQPRLPGGDVLGDGAGPRGAADRPGAARLRRSDERTPPGARSSGRSSPSSPTTATSRRSTRSRCAAGGSAWVSRTS